MKREGCILCDDSKPLTCSNCPEGQRCQISIPMDCQSCPKAVCVPDEAAQEEANESNGPSAGAIAGGVIGGLVAIALVTYLVWRFCIKNKRTSLDQSNWAEDGEHTKEGAEKDFASRRSQRASTHTVNSIASTVLTRASNIIQIAYIPGVTNRATPTSPTVLVPPVPPIPVAHSDNSLSPYQDQHFFVPGDLRDSTYSGYSGVTDRTSMARSSYAPRSSVASTIYGKNVVVSPLPAQKGTLLKPSLVSVKSRGGNSSGSNTPPVPSVDYEKYEKDRTPSPAFSIGATFFKNATTSTATAVKPQIVRVRNSPKQVEVKSKSSPTISVQDEKPASVVEVSETPEKEKTEEKAEVKAEVKAEEKAEEETAEEETAEEETAEKENGSGAVTVAEEATSVDQGPFADPPAQPNGHLRNRSVGSVTEPSSKRASRASLNEKRNSSSSQHRDPSPFSDQNAVKDN